MTALPFLPHEIDLHPDGARFLATVEERFGLDADIDLPTRIADLEDEVAELEETIDALDALRRRLRDALSALLQAAEAGNVPQDMIDSARDALTRTDQ